MTKQKKHHRNIPFVPPRGIGLKAESAKAHEEYRIVVDDLRRNERKVFYTKRLPSGIRSMEKSH